MPRVSPTIYGRIINLVNPGPLLSGKPHASRSRSLSSPEATQINICTLRAGSRYVHSPDTRQVETSMDDATHVTMYSAIYRDKICHVNSHLTDKRIVL